MTYGEELLHRLQECAKFGMASEIDDPPPEWPDLMVEAASYIEKLDGVESHDGSDLILQETRCEVCNAARFGSSLPCPICALPSE